MEKEKPNIDLGKYQTYQRKFPKRLIRYIIYAAVLLFVIYYGFQYITELQEEQGAADDFEIKIETSDSTSTPR